MNARFRRHIRWIGTSFCNNLRSPRLVLYPILSAYDREGLSTSPGPIIKMPRHVGVVPPPAGVTADFDYSNPWLYNVNIVLISLGLVVSFLCLVLRIYTKTQILHRLGWEDGKINLWHRKNGKVSSLLANTDLSAFIVLAWVRYLENIASFNPLSSLTFSLRCSHLEHKWPLSVRYPRTDSIGLRAVP